MSIIRIKFPKNKVELGKSGSEDFVKGYIQPSVQPSIIIPAYLVNIDKWYPPLVVLLRHSDDLVSLQDDKGNVITVNSYYFSIPYIGIGEITSGGSSEKVNIYVYPKVYTNDYLVCPELDYDKLQRGEESKMCKTLNDDGFPFVLNSLYDIFGINNEEEGVNVTELPLLLISSIGESSNE